jgi:hypothetical protein
MIYKEVSESAFRAEFKGGSYENNFSYEGLGALYSYLYDLSEDIGENINLDVVAICCDYTEYEDFAKFKDEHSHLDIQSEKDIQDHTTYIKIYNSKGFIIQNI